MKNHYELYKKAFFGNLENAIANVKMFHDPNRYCRYQIASPAVPNGFEFVSNLGTFLLAYYMEESPYYHDDSLLELTYKGLCRYEKNLHEDGSADLLTTNFHDPAETGFESFHSFPSVELIRVKTRHTEWEDKVYDKCLTIMRRMGDAMVNLGFHTPNHRWVISSALATIYKQTGDKKYLDHINRFLREGVDCDECGEFTERSTGSYNKICDYAFLLLADYLDDPSFYEYVRRNITLMLHLTEFDGTVNTLNSSRWDQGGVYSLAPYYCYYLVLALIDRNPEFAYMADKLVECGNPAVFARIQYILVFLVLHPELEERQKEIIPVAPKADQSIFLPNSHIAREYRPELQLTMTTLSSRTPVFFQMNYGSSILQLRFAGSFFGDPHAQFRPQEIIPIEGGYRLVCKESAGYRSQMAEAPATSDWRRMDHSKRKIINVQHFDTTIDVLFLQDGVTLKIHADGCERIPTKLEVVVEPNGKFMTDSVCMMPKAGDYAYLRTGKALYHIDALRYFEIDSGFFNHMNAQNMRGAAPDDPKKFTIAMTAHTPQDSTVTIRAKTLRNTYEGEDMSFGFLGNKI